MSLENRVPIFRFCWPTTQQLLWTLWTASGWDWFNGNRHGKLRGWTEMNWTYMKRICKKMQEIQPEFVYSIQQIFKSIYHVMQCNVMFRNLFEGWFTKVFHLERILLASTTKTLGSTLQMISSVKILRASNSVRCFSLWNSQFLKLTVNTQVFHSVSPVKDII